MKGVGASKLSPHVGAMSADAQTLTVLGIESSCDETAAAVLRLAHGAPQVLSSVIWRQDELHAPYRGVVPEIAARSHLERLDETIAKALADAQTRFEDLDAVAATAGPGLIGGVMVGLVTAKAIALARGLPLVAVNHLEGHALSPRLAAPTPFPYLLLLASGGHCQFLAVEGLGRYRRLGATIDDAAGEAFDKVGALLGLGFPGGPAVERAARLARDPDRFDLPRPLKGRPGCDMSFAGLKTAVQRIATAGGLGPEDKNDLAAAFQTAVIEVLEDRCRNAMAGFAAEREVGDLRFVVAGGVAANAALRARLEALCFERGFAFSAPPLAFCTDNAAMIALAGAERLAVGLLDDLDAPARPRWPLDAEAAAARPTHVAGRKGAKA